MRIVFVGDLHSGSHVGICPPEVEWPGTGTFRGGGHRANEVQRGLYDLWQASTGNRRWAKPDILVAGGDLCDGQGSKRYGTEQWTTEPEIQANTAVQLLQDWKAGQVWVIDGSGYHKDLRGMSLDGLVAQRIGAAAASNGAVCNHELYLTAGGVTVHCAHKVGISKVFHYKTTPLARALLLAFLQDAMRTVEDVPDTSLIVRWHAHYYLHVAYGHTAGWICPGWQAKTPFTLEADPHGYTPRFGFIGMEIEDGRWEYEARTWAVEEAQPAPVGRWRVADGGGGAGHPAGDAGRHRGGTGKAATNRPHRRAARRR